MGEIRNENLRHTQAFEYYFSLGADRSHKAVADHFDVTLSTVQHWSHWFNWRERILDRDNEVARELARETMKKAIKMRISYLNFIQAQLGRAVEKFREGSLEPNNVQDVLRLIKAEVLLTDSTGQLSQQVTEESRKMVRELTVREVYDADGETLDEGLARKIANAIVEHSTTEIIGDGGEDEFGSLGDSQEESHEQLAP